MTRIEKYKEYREEIAHSAQIGKTIALDDSKLDKYKAEIDSINPAILSSIEDEQTKVAKGVTEIPINEKQIPNHIANMFATINKAKGTINQENISTLLFNAKNNSILDGDLDFKEDWLMQNEDYAKFVKINFASCLNNQSSLEDAQKNLQSKYDNFNSANTAKDVVKISQIQSGAQKKASHYVFVISIAVASIFFIIIVALLITKMLVK